MNIHEHQAKQILKKYGAVVPRGVYALTVDELIEKAVKRRGQRKEAHRRDALELEDTGLRRRRRPKLFEGMHKYDYFSEKYYDNEIKDKRAPKLEDDSRSSSISTSSDKKPPPQAPKISFNAVIT